ncbi:MAG: hypothetical protein DSZ31_06775, partial [Gammaproteobacteria bacterium]
MPKQIDVKKILEEGGNFEGLDLTFANFRGLTIENANFNDTSMTAGDFS